MHQHFKLLSPVASCGGWLICRRVYRFASEVVLSLVPGGEVEEKPSFDAQHVAFVYSAQPQAFHRVWKLRENNVFSVKRRSEVHAKKGTFG